MPSTGWPPYARSDRGDAVDPFYDPAEWSFLSPLVDPTFIMSSPTPPTVMYLRNANPGWFPLFDAFVQKSYPNLVPFLGTVDQYERRHPESFFSDVQGLGDAKNRLKDFFSPKNFYIKNLKQDEKEKQAEESKLYVEAVDALSSALPQFADSMDRLRIMIKQRGSAFNVMSGDADPANLINEYWQLYATVTSVEPQLQPLRDGFALLAGLAAFEGTSVEGQFKDFQEKLAAAEQTVRSMNSYAYEFWNAITALSEEIAKAGFPGQSAADLGNMVRRVQQLLADIGNAYRITAQACARWATANADDLASKKIYLDNPIGGKIYRAVNSFLDMGLGVVRVIELDTKIITGPLGLLKTAVTTALEIKDSKTAWDNPDRVGEQIGKAAKFGVVGTNLDTAQDGAKYTGYGTTATNMLNSVDAIPLGGLAEEVPVVGAGLQIARGAIDLTKIDAQQISTVDKAEAEYAQQMVNTCLGSWNYLGILDFSAGVQFEGRTERGIRISVLDRINGKWLTGWVDSLGVFYSDEGTDHTIALATMAAKNDKAARHQAIGARPAWDDMTFLGREREGSLDVFTFTCYLSFDGRGDYNGMGEVRIYYSPAEFRYLYWECDDLPTMGLYARIAPYQESSADMITENNGVFELHMISDDWTRLFDQNKDEAVALNVAVMKWKEWHEAGLLVIAGSYSAILQ